MRTPDEEAYVAVMDDVLAWMEEEREASPAEYALALARLAVAVNRLEPWEGVHHTYTRTVTTRAHARFNALTFLEAASVYASRGEMHWSVIAARLATFWLHRTGEITIRRGPVCA